MGLKLHVIICSTRPGRIGPSVANWFSDYAKANSAFDIDLVDLADFNLPVFNEPKHPVLRDYQHDHTKRWSASVESADAYVFVIPEYNHCPPPSFYNALNYLVKEWGYKPAAFVGYAGGVSGGLRAIQQAKTLVTTLRMVAINEGVMIPMVGSLIDENKNFKTNELIDTSAQALLNELHRWAVALKPMRS